METASLPSYKGCRFTYFIVPTNRGKVYICFAIARQTETTYKVASSVFSTKEKRNRFSKTNLCNIAKNRLNTDKFYVTVDSEENNYKIIADKASATMHNLVNSIKRKINDGNYYHTLAYDCFSTKQLSDNDFITMQGIYKWAVRHHFKTSYQTIIDVDFLFKLYKKRFNDIVS